MAHLGNGQRAQLKVVPHLKSLLVSLPSNQVLLEPDYYCWQTSPKASLLLSVGTTDHTLELNIFGSAINNNTHTEKNPACVICSALQNENKSSALPAMDPPGKGQTGTCCSVISFSFLLLRKVSFKRDLHLLWIVAFKKYSNSKTAQKDLHEINILVFWSLNVLYDSPPNISGISIWHFFQLWILTDLEK